MFPLASIGTGLSIIGGIEGLFAGDRAKQQAEEAQQAAIRDLKLAGGQAYDATRDTGARGLYSLTGTLNDALAREGRGLGAAEAGAGVYNSSAVAGALANQGAANAATTGAYTTNLADTLAQIAAGNQRDVAGLQYQTATNGLNYARQQQAGSVNGLMQYLGNLGQVNFGRTGAPNANSVGMAGVGKANSVLPMPADPGATNDFGLQRTPMSFRGGGVGGFAY